jgi:hypothetical protein
MILIYATVVLLILIALIIWVYSLHRYAFLHTKMADEHIMNNYMKKKRVSCKERVIVSLTTTPYRMKKIKPMVRSIMDQSVRIDQIALNIPNQTDNDKWDIPENLENLINVYHTGRSYGRGTRCIPTVLRETDAKTIIILLDDYFIYEYDFIEKLIEEYQRNPGICLYNKGFILIQSDFVKEEIVDITREDVNDKLLMKYIKVPKKKLNRFNVYISNFAM